MRPLYLIGSVLLSIAAVYAVIGASGYQYSSTVKVPDDISWKPDGDVEGSSPEEEVEEVRPREAHWVHSKNAFDKLRGEPVKIEGPKVKGPDAPVGEYEFEVRGIHILGESKMALMTSKLLRSKSSRGRRPTSTASRSSTIPIRVHVGEQIEETGYVVEAIESGLVTIKDKEGLSMELVYSLKDENALKRGEVAYKNEVGRQRYYSKQNSFNTPKKLAIVKKPAVPAKPKPTPYNREAEMKKRHEAMKAEMKRLKDLREKSSSKSKSKDSKYERRKR